MSVKAVSPAGHWLFQLANIFLLLSYASKDLLTLRVVLMLATLCFALWGSLALATIAVDTVVWNSIFCLINITRVTQLIWERRPIQFEREEHEQVYAQVFGPVGVSRIQFKALMKQCLMRSLRKGSLLIEAGNDATNLTLIYSGRMEIISSPKDGRPPEKVGTVTKMHFVESPQWANIQVQRRKALDRNKKSLGRSSSMTAASPEERMKYESSTLGTGETILLEVQDGDIRAASAVEVTFRAETDCTFFSWPMEHLQAYVASCPAIAAPLNSIVGADVATKLFEQTKGRAGSFIATDKRVYIPLDEPSEILDQPECYRDSAIHDTETSQKEGTDEGNSLLVEKRWLEKRSMEDTRHDEELSFIISHKTSLNNHEISALLSKGRWRQILRKGTVLIREGEPVTSLSMILEGSLSVHKGEGKNECQLHSILPQQMVGSLELLESGSYHLAGETIIALGPCTFISWDVDDLRQLLALRPRLRAQLTTLIAMDLAVKFRQVEEMV